MKPIKAWGVLSLISVFVAGIGAIADIPIMLFGSLLCAIYCNQWVLHYELNEIKELINRP